MLTLSVIMSKCPPNTEPVRIMIKRRMIRNHLVEFEVQTYIDLEPEQQNRPQHLLQRPEDLFHMLI